MFRKFIRRGILSNAGAMAVLLCLSSAPRAELPATVLDTPAARALMAAPDMQKAMAASQRHDFATAIRLFRSESHRGNPMAQVLLARFYYEGAGVPRNNVAALELLKPVFARNEEPTRSIAADLAKMIAESLRGSSNPNDRALSMLAAALPLLANPTVQQFGRNVEYNRAHGMIVCGPLGCW